jgi:putative transposase
MKEKVKIKGAEKLLKSYVQKSDKLLQQYEKTLEYEMKKFVMIKNILNTRDDIWCPPKDIYMHALDINTWFDICESDTYKTFFNDKKHQCDELTSVTRKCKKVILKLSENQRKTVDKWLLGYRKMYNASLEYIKKNVKTNKKVLNWKKTRQNLKNVKDKIVEDTDIKVHNIDYSIKLACQNYKTGLTNLKRGNIKHFRIRYWNSTKELKIMDLEKNDFKSGSIRKNVLGKVNGYYNGKKYDFTEIKCDCRLQKNEKTKEYTLFVPEEIKIKENKKKGKVISLDPGVRTFLTGITSDKVVKIGENNNKIRKILKKKDEIMNREEIPKSIKKKIELRSNKKIRNLVDELHWKTINYLTGNYELIKIGDMSVKGIISKKSSNINGMTKRMASALSFYKFRERLKYKCYITKTKYKLVDERYTSKMCSNCGNIDEKLGSSKEYKCKKCEVLQDRDVNGARNIYLK